MLSRAMRRLELENPASRFEQYRVEYEEGAPEATLHVYDDASH